MNIINELERFILKEIIINEEMAKKSIAPDEDLLLQGIIDSLGFMKLTGFIEKTYGIKVADEDMDPDNFKDLNSIKRYIESKQK